LKSLGVILDFEMQVAMVTQNYAEKNGDFGISHFLVVVLHILSKS